MVFSSLPFLRAEEKAVLTVSTVEISSKSFWPKGPKIFGRPKNLCWRPNLNLKLRSQLAPSFFFLK